jgi:hypothetical protein
LFKEYTGFDVSVLNQKSVIKIEDQEDKYSGVYLIKSVSREMLKLTNRHGEEVTLDVDGFREIRGQTRFTLKIIQ